MRHVVLVAVRRPVHLSEEAGIGRIAVRVVRAAQPHGGLVLEARRIDGRDQVLLLLHHGEQHLLADAARARRLVDDRGRGLLSRALVRRAILVRRLVLGVEGHGFQAPGTAARRALLVEERLDLGLAHRIGVEELAVRDDVAGIEVVLLRQLQLAGLGLLHVATPLDDPHSAHDQRDHACGRHHGDQHSRDALRQPGPLPPARRAERIPAIARAFARATFAIAA